MRRRCGRRRGFWRRRSSRRRSVRVWWQDWTVHGAKITISRQDRAVLYRRERIGEAVPQIEGITEPRLGGYPRLLYVRRNEADAARQKLRFDLQIELRLPVTDPDQSLCQIDSAHPELRGVFRKLFCRPFAIGLGKEDGQ